MTQETSKWWNLTTMLRVHQAILQGWAKPRHDDSDESQMGEIDKDLLVINIGKELIQY